MRSIGGMLDASRGLGQGFDVLRIALAIAVVTWHTPIIAADDLSHLNTRVFWLFDTSIMQMFFGLSGFLIAGSALRLSLGNFLINRALRIAPALAVEIVLAVLVIGPLFTVLPIATYFSDPLTYHYLTNIVGLINYRLPGVFTQAPTWIVNGSLWTVPFEIACYACMVVFIRLGMLRRPLTILAFCAAFLAAGLAMWLSGYHQPPHGAVMKAADILFFGRGSKLFVAFGAGIALFLYRYRIPYSWPLFWACAAFYALTAALGHKHYASPPTDLVSIVPVIYMMGFIGVSRLEPLPFFSRGDYSYGIYLYGWPVMQIVRALEPALGQNRIWLWLMSVPAIVLFAAFSWHFIEEPILALRKKFSFVARQRLSQAPSRPELARAKLDQPGFEVQAPPG